MRGSANGSVAPARGPENRNVAHESNFSERGHRVFALHVKAPAQPFRLAFRHPDSSRLEPVVFLLTVIYTNSGSQQNPS